MGIDQSSLLSEQVLSKLSPEERRKMGKAGRLASEIAIDVAHKSEREMQEQIRGWLRIKGWYFAWQRTDKRARGREGQPDFIICMPTGRFAAIECKMPGGKMRPEQEQAMKEIVGAGGLHLVATSAQRAIDFLITFSTIE